jgi:hypothetical protein
MNRIQTYFQYLTPLNYITSVDVTHKGVALHGVTHDVGSWTGADVARQAATLARLMSHTSCDVWVLVVPMRLARLRHLNRHHFLPPFFLFSSSLSRNRAPPPPLYLAPPGGSVRPPFGLKLGHSSRKVASPFEPCRFSFYYFYCFL